MVLLGLTRTQFRILSALNINVKRQAVKLHPKVFRNLIIYAESEQLPDATSHVIPMAAMSLARIPTRTKASLATLIWEDQISSASCSNAKMYLFMRRIFDLNRDRLESTWHSFLSQAKSIPSCLDIGNVMKGSFWRTHKSRCSQADNTPWRALNDSCMTTGAIFTYAESPLPTNVKNAD